MTDRRNELKGELFRETLKAFGQARLAVTGTSMLPTIWPGDVVEVRRESVAEISAGDVVLCARHAPRPRNIKSLSNRPRDFARMRHQTVVFGDRKSLRP